MVPSSRPRRLSPISRGSATSVTPQRRATARSGGTVRPERRHSAGGGRGRGRPEHLRRAPRLVRAGQMLALGRVVTVVPGILAGERAELVQDLVAAAQAPE